MEKFIFKNCDYKNLIVELQEKGIMIDAVITDPPYGLAESINLVSVIWVELAWITEIGIIILIKKNGFACVHHS